MKTDEQLQHLRHSLAHLLAAAVMELWPDAQPTIGPVIEDGFYYDFAFRQPITEADLPKIEKKMREILPTWSTFERSESTPEEARREVAGNPFKRELIDDCAKSGEKITFYRSGGFVDLCRGGHVDDMRNVKPDAFQLTKIAGAYWRGDEKNAMLTRIYGMAFPTKKELEDRLAVIAEAAKRDHRKLGQELDLFFFSQNVGSGLPIFTPRGTIVRNAIRQFSLELQLAAGYEEVYTPNMNKAELFKISGHYEKFRSSMFKVLSNYGEEEFYLKPMNCPQHTQIYAAKLRSYRDLPLRYADFANLYRDEKPGEIGGLTRVRYFSQDDSHCFCREDQIEKEMANIFGMIKKLMRAYQLEYWIRLSLRDPKSKKDYLGADEVWEKAETTMGSFLKRHAIPHTRAEGEAAFYGPKMDLMCTTAIGNEWQLATIQLDYIMPERFHLTYIDKGGKEARPVMIHKAMAGSLERFIAILLEHTGGNLPLWLSPVHVQILPVATRHRIGAIKLAKEFHLAGIRAYVDEANETVGYKIRTASRLRVPYVVVFGDKEAVSAKLAVRVRGTTSVRLVTKKRFFERVGVDIVKRAFRVT
ncbi:MAG: threonine--tRNA ligase [bacterium]